MIKIYTFHNHPNFIKYQKDLFSKFVEDYFVYYVVNTAETDQMKDCITLACKVNNVDFIELPFLNTHASASIQNSVPLQWTWDNYISKNDCISVIMDSDMFLVRPFNFTDFLDNNDIAGVIHKRGQIWYPWNGLSIFSGTLPDKRTMNFREGIINSIEVDVSGNLYHYIQKHPDLQVKPVFDGGFICQRNSNRHLLPAKLKEKYEDVFLSQIFEQSFFHLRAGSNYNKDKGYERKMKFLKYMIDTALQDVMEFPLTNGYRFIETDDILNLEAPTHWSEYTRYCNGKWINFKPSFVSKIKRIKRKIVTFK